MLRTGLLLTTALAFLVACGSAPASVPSGTTLPAASTLRIQSVLSGTLRGWGLNTTGYDQSISPAGLSDVQAVAAGRYHSLALKQDGTVVAWGDPTYSAAVVPAGLSDVVAIASGTYHSFAIKRDGTLVAWGRNDYGQGSVPPSLGPVTAVDGGTRHSIALKQNGTVAAWGRNEFGQTNVPVGLQDVIAIAAGTNHNLALKSNGTVVAWGDNASGQTSVPAGLQGVIAIAAGTDHSLALKSDGTVVAWGGDAAGQTDVPAGLNDVKAISAGSIHSVALKKDGTVVTWGAAGDTSNYGQATLPLGINDGHNVIAVTAGYYNNLAVIAPPDSTPPIITVKTSPTVPNGTNDWYTSPVSVNWAVEDSESDLTNSSGCDLTTLSVDTPGTTLTCTASSRGGESSQSIDIKVDVTPPMLAPTVSALVGGAGNLINPVPLGSSVSVTPNATDSTSQVASAVCDPVDTSTVGPKSVSCTATDNAGNTTTVQVTINVVYAFQGLFQPVENLPTLNTVKGGSAVPIKFSLAGQSSLDVLAAGYPKVTPVACDTTAPTNEIDATLPTTSNSGLKYEAGLYIYVWKTSSTPGCFQLNVRLKDNTDHYALFKLR